MLLRITWFGSRLALVGAAWLLMLGAAGVAVAQEAPEGPTHGASEEFGIGLRLRNVRLPQALLELFVERAAAGISQVGIGVEGIRRTGNLELSVGLEWDSLSAEDGVWIEKGEQIPRDEPDFVRFDGFGWITLDAMAAWHRPLSERVSLRYGAGLGLGILLGEVLRTDYACTGPEIDSCRTRPGGKVDAPEEDIPPVFPVINLVVGVQVKATERITINLEGGLRTVPFIGISGGYFFE